MVHKDQNLVYLLYRNCIFTEFSNYIPILSQKLNVQYRMVGDAVAPKLAFAIASRSRRISEPQFENTPFVPNIIHIVSDPSPQLIGRCNFEFVNGKMKLDRKFHELVPGKEVRGCRVELENNGAGFIELSTTQNQPHIIKWDCYSLLGEGKQNSRSQYISLNDAKTKLALASNKLDLRNKFEEFISDLENTLPKSLPDATTLQGYGVIGLLVLLDLMTWSRY